MIEFLSPREEEELRRAIERGSAWARVIARHFADGARLRLGSDLSLAERDLGEPREAIDEAARWCTGHGLHLLSYEGEGPGGDPIGERRYFMAVG
ncbi:MAG TPA: hypothetical protein VFB95_08115 [Candidatus Cryosericum sp.]|nr:hypothetical protein [Candidatus Cryosericum sp.]